MGFIRPSVLLFALLMTVPAGWRYVSEGIDLTSLLTRFVIAVLVAAVLLAGLRLVTAGYGEPSPPEPSVPVNPQSLEQQGTRPAS